MLMYDLACKMIRCIPENALMALVSSQGSPRWVESTPLPLQSLFDEISSPCWSA